MMMTTTKTITMVLLWIFLLEIGPSSATGFTRKIHDFDGGWKTRTTLLRKNVPGHISNRKGSFVESVVYPPPLFLSKNYRTHHHDIMLLNIRGGIDDGNGGCIKGNPDFSSKDDSSSLSFMSFPCPNEVVLKRIHKVMGFFFNIGVWVHIIAFWKNYRLILDHIWTFYKLWMTPYIALVVLFASKNICLIHRYVEATKNNEDLSSTLNDPNITPNSSTSNSVSSWYGYDVSERKFRVWLSYQLNGTSSSSIHDNNITSRIHLFPKRKKDKFLREAWLQQRLLTSKSMSQNLVACPVQMAVGIFRHVLEDELDPNTDGSQDDSQLLMKFLNTEYGIFNTTQINATNWNKSTNETQLEAMQDFLNWFRSLFPYYYNNCRNCGEFSRDIPRESVLGMAYPTTTEVELGKASKVEYFHCQNCGTVTRFPRYNSALSISTNRKGRCGEYSLLLFRMLRALGHEVRYVVDCGNDHVWVEIGRNMTATTDGCFHDGKAVNLSSSSEEGNKECNRTRIQWLHLDPCEAAVNKNLLYQQWGRNIRSVFAFHIPHRCSGAQLNGESKCDKQVIPIIEDVTKDYTSDAQHLTRSSVKQDTVDSLSAEIQDKIDALQQ